MSRNRAWRRAQNKRIICKRRNIVRNFWRGDISSPQGMFRKWNFTCSCGMCKLDRYHGVREKRRRDLGRAVRKSDYY